MIKKIIVTGASGLIGTRLTAELISKGYDVVVFTRSVSKRKSTVHPANNNVEWDYRNPDAWQSYFENSYAIIHLAGASIAGKRFTKAYKKKVENSRIISTQNIVKAISAVKNKPKVFLCASGINYYGDSNARVLTENSPAGNDFLANVCSRWENEAMQAEKAGVRRVSIRTSPVLSLQDGMLKTLYPIFKSYLGASLGSGRQWFSWIHIEDIIRTYIYALENEFISGSINASSPYPVSMKEFAGQFGKVINRPVYFRVPLFMLKTFVGEAADFITASLRVIPAKLQRSGFIFNYAELGKALNDIVKNHK
jgi:uncharacterized protein (TIGR01777 family)